MALRSQNCQKHSRCCCRLSVLYDGAYQFGVTSQSLDNLYGALIQLAKQPISSVTVAQYAVSSANRPDGGRCLGGRASAASAATSTRHIGDAVCAGGLRAGQRLGGAHSSRRSACKHKGRVRGKGLTDSRDIGQHRSPLEVLVRFYRKMPGTLPSFLKIGV